MDLSVDKAPSRPVSKLYDAHVPIRSSTYFCNSMLLALFACECGQGNEVLHHTLAGSASKAWYTLYAHAQQDSNNSVLHHGSSTAVT